MIKVKNIKTVRDTRGNIKGYVIEDEIGATKEVGSRELKEAIRAKKVEVINLTLTSDGRLVSKKETEKLEDDSNDEKYFGVKVVEDFLKKQRVRFRTTMGKYENNLYNIMMDMMPEPYTGEIVVPDNIKKVEEEDPNGLGKTFARMALDYYVSNYTQGVVRVENRGNGVCSLDVDLVIMNTIPKVHTGHYVVDLSDSITNLAKYVRKYWNIPLEDVPSPYRKVYYRLHDRCEDGSIVVQNSEYETKKMTEEQLYEEVDSCRINMIDMEVKDRKLVRKAVDMREVCRSFNSIKYLDAFEVQKILFYGLAYINEMSKERKKAFYDEVMKNEGMDAEDLASLVTDNKNWTYERYRGLDTACRDEVICYIYKVAGLRDMYYAEKE